MKKPFSSILVLALMAGCSVTPAAKPQLPDDGYDEIARNSYAFDYCVGNGMMSPETGAWGKAYYAAVLTAYQHDAQRLSTRSKVIAQGNHPVSNSNCNILAMHVLEMKAKQPVPRVSSAGGGGSTWQDIPKFTTCNRVFGQVNCTTY